MLASDIFSRYAPSVLASDLVYRSDDKFELQTNTVYPARLVSVFDTHAAANLSSAQKMNHFIIQSEKLPGRNKCALCGLDMFSGYSLNPSLIIRELLKHTNSLVDSQLGYLRISADDEENVRAHSLITKVYPQLVMLDIVNKQYFMDNLRKIMKEYNMNSEHSIDVVFAEGSWNSCYDSEIKEMFAKADYSCAIVDDVIVTHSRASFTVMEDINRGTVCGLVYDSGMPHIDIVLKHMEMHSKIIKPDGK